MNSLTFDSAAGLARRLHRFPLFEKECRGRPTPSGAFDRLSLGNQKVAASLYEAQNAGTSPTGSTLKPLTLNQIAAKRQAGQGWGQIFRDMKAQGLLHEKTLRQVVTRYGKFTGLERTANARSNGKLNALGAGASGYVDGGSDGNGHGGK